MSSFISLFIISTLINLYSSYTISFSKAFDFYSGYLAVPYSIRLYDSDYILICFEERDDLSRSGLCKTGKLDILNEELTFSDNYIFERERATDPYEIQLKPSNKLGEYFIIGYTDSATSARGKGLAVIGKYNLNGEISYGLPAIFNPDDNDQTHLIELEDNGDFIVCASVGPFDRYVTACRIGEYNIDDLSLKFAPNYYNVTSQVRTDGMGILRISRSSFLICYGRGLQKIGVCNIGSLFNKDSNGINSQILFTNDYTFNFEGGTEGVKITRIESSVDGNQTIAICYESTDKGVCTVAVLQPVGTTYTLLIQKSYDFKTEIINIPDIHIIPAGSLSNVSPILLVCYVTISDAECKFGEYNKNDYSLTFDTKASGIFNTQGTGRIDLVYLTGEKFIVCYVAFSGSTPLFNKGQCKFGAVSL